MNNVSIRFFDPIIFALNALVAHWKKIFLIGLFFTVPELCIEWVQPRFKLLLQFGQPDEIMTRIVTVSIIAIGLLLAKALLSLWEISTLAHTSLHIYDGKRFGFNDIVSSLHYIFAILGSQMVCLLFCVIVGFSGFAMVMLTRPFLVSFLGNNGFMIMIGVLGGIAFLLFWWLFFRTLLTTFFIVDNDWGAYRSLVASYHVTKNKVWLLVGVDFVILAFAALLGALLLACAFALLTLLNAGEYSYQISGALAYFGFIMLGGWMSALANGYIYRKLLESQESSNTQQPL